MPRAENGRMGVLEVFQANHGAVSLCHCRLGNNIEEDIGQDEVAVFLADVGEGSLSNVGQHAASDGPGNATGC